MGLATAIFFYQCCATIAAQAVRVSGDNPTMAGTITALKLQKKNKERVNVYLDDRYAFSLAAIEAAKLKQGQVLSDQEIEDLLGRDSFHKAYAKALRFLSYRPRSGAEVRRYLQGKKVTPAIEAEVVERLTAAGLLDDQAFANYWVENRENFNPRGRYALRYELRQKGVSEETIASALEDIDEEESAYRALISRARRMPPLDRGSFRKKLGSFLRRRGFSYEAINAALERIWQGMVEEGRMLDESEG
jgi:regulatory protein